MSAHVPPDPPADRTELDRHVRKTAAISALRRIGDLTSELEREDRRSQRALVLVLVCLLIVAIAAGVIVWRASAAREARKTEAAAAETSAKAAKLPVGPQPLEKQRLP